MGNSSCRTPTPDEQMFGRSYCVVGPAAIAERRRGIIMNDALLVAGGSSMVWWTLGQ